ncbi:3'(2'),5'-bisphosphate nucleotidase CysQ [Phyllobacterium leguminum]|uniref:3'(2'),5'-bisphosphate nucleotidase CysQ n=1 Tax=Phyllobacterium leguminum TaxID=314237 RepID=A0A318T500_9HYPH|nr:3'(2'),5'-bisphosphate nucleotidase CysQ [Phyllobacterium leguminum]PYE87883.1 3'(2'),5'-bisphosphate nucleotidase [Phyllobacterium leguminum]
MKILSNADSVTGDDALLVLMERTAIAAGRAIMEIYEAGCDVSLKIDGSPVTLADKAAEAVILAALREATPDIAIVAEEEVSEGRAPILLGERFFLVDPLDGTREFIGRNGDFTVNIALIEQGIPVLGVVYAPARGLLFSGGPKGAREVTVGSGGLMTAYRSIAVRDCPARMIAVASRSHRTPETDGYLTGFDIAECVSVGSSLKFCLVARGEADIYPRFGRTMEWDTAAGDAILRAAGGGTWTPEGELLAYGKNGFANPFFIARGRLAPVTPSTDSPS